MKAATFFLIVVLQLSSSLCAQGRTFIKDRIDEWGECKNVAITLTGGDLALYGRNGWAGSMIPRRLSEALENLTDDDDLIDDVQLTESGSWLILYGNNGCIWYDIPLSLEREIKALNDEGEVITQVTFNDHGEWIVITTNRISSSSTSIYSWIEDGLEEYGALWAAHLTDDGLVLCYENGYKFLGNVPENLREKLRESRLNVYRIKFLSDGAYFFADKYGRFSYNM